METTISTITLCSERLQFAALIIDLFFCHVNTEVSLGTHSPTEVTWSQSKAIWNNEAHGHDALLNRQNEGTVNVTL